MCSIPEQPYLKHLEDMFGNQGDKLSQNALSVFLEDNGLGEYIQSSQCDRDDAPYDAWFQHPICQLTAAQ